MGSYLSKEEMKGKIEDTPRDRLDAFFELYMKDILNLVKTRKQKVTVNNEYQCSECDYELKEDEWEMHYCPECSVSFDCCNEDEEPCLVCGEKAGRFFGALLKEQDVIGKEEK